MIFKRFEEINFVIYIIYNSWNRREEQKNVTVGLSNIKRRSLSESSVNKAGRKEMEDFSDSSIINAVALSQAKVAKLEVKSSKLLNIQSAFRNFSQSSDSSPLNNEQTAVHFSVNKKGHISPLLSLLSNNNSSSSPSISPKKSRSSENVSVNDMYGKGKSPNNPFSFSLATPTSSLSSFKFLESPSPISDGKSRATSASLLSQMPDFSIFNKVPTPTDELPPSGKFVFMKRPSGSNSHSLSNAKGDVKMGMTDDDCPPQEVWSRRTDVPAANQRPREKRSSYRL